MIALKKQLKENKYFSLRVKATMEIIDKIEIQCQVTMQAPIFEERRNSILIKRNWTARSELYFLHPL
jgi:hypothetical protein